jgi:hypothetical protein
MRASKLRLMLVVARTSLALRSLIVSGITILALSLCRATR